MTDDDDAYADDRDASSPVGRPGRLVVATRGPGGPGEVLVELRGGTEAYLAWSEQALPIGTTVLVYNDRGSRTVDVMQWVDPLAGPPVSPPTP